MKWIEAHDWKEFNGQRLQQDNVSSYLFPSVSMQFKSFLYRFLWFLILSGSFWRLFEILARRWCISSIEPGVSVFSWYKLKFDHLLRGMASLDHGRRIRGLWSMLLRSQCKIYSMAQMWWSWHTLNYDCGVAIVNAVLVMLLYVVACECTVHTMARKCRCSLQCTMAKTLPRHDGTYTPSSYHARRTYFRS